MSNTGSHRRFHISVADERAWFFLLIFSVFFLIFFPFPGLGDLLASPLVLLLLLLLLLLPLRRRRLLLQLLLHYYDDYYDYYDYYYYYYSRASGVPIIFSATSRAALPGAEHESAQTGQQPVPRSVPGLSIFLTSGYDVIGWSSAVDSAVARSFI